MDGRVRLRVVNIILSSMCGSSFRFPFFLYFVSKQERQKENEYQLTLLYT